MRASKILLLIALFSMSPVIVAAPAIELQTSDSTPDISYLVRVHYESMEQISDLHNAYDVLEFNDREAKFVLALVTQSEQRELEAAGYRVIYDDRRNGELAEAEAKRLAHRGGTGIPGFPCYRTVEEGAQLYQSIATTYPQLATIIDAGDSWEKVNGLGGYDQTVLKLTNSATTGDKPAFVMTCSLHAREYTPAELCNRFASYLVEGYGVDADATWILDHHEVHLMSYANPDGRKQAETGLSWRKNTNTDYCGATSNTRGVDLNRNFEFRWGCCNGSSTSECSLTYRGPSPGSEPEVDNIQNYLRSVFPDQRGEDDLDAAPDDAVGMYFDTHSFSELVLWPWGWGSTAPNIDALTTLGRKFAWFNDYRPQQAIELYVTDGTTDDFGYGDLGVPSYTFELGTSFFQDCATFENTILPDNLPALVYAVKASRAPYLLPAGPDVTSIMPSPALVDAGDPLIVNAVIDGTRFNNSNGTETTYAITGAELSVGALFWDASATAQPMAAADGAFDATVETATLSVDTSSLTGGRYTVYIRGNNANGSTGVVSAQHFYVRDGSEGSIDGTITDMNTGQPLVATVSIPALNLSLSSSAADGSYSVELPQGSWIVDVSSPGYVSQTGNSIDVTSSTSTPFDFALAPVPSILLVDDDDNTPDVRGSYTAALDALGLDYLVWDTGNSDNEPPASLLADVETVIWFTGDEFGGAAGPGSQAEADLSARLDDFACMLIAGQDYYYDRGLTPFIDTYLGVASATSDVGQTIIEGTQAFSGYGPYTLTYPYTNYSDTVNPDGASQAAFFSAANGNAAVSKEAPTYRTSFWSFGLETVTDEADRLNLMSRFMSWCGDLQLEDADSDGTINSDDCAPLDPTVALMPGRATDLRVGDPALDSFAWNAPTNGGAVDGYDLIRMDDVLDMGAITCVENSTAALTGSDVSVPAPGGLYFYLVRSLNGCGQTLGSNSDSVPRQATTCP